MLLRKEQYRVSDDEERSLSYARNMISWKVFNCRWSLERTLRDHSMRVNSAKLKSVSNELNAGLDKIKKTENLASLRGIEGELASRYFSVFDELIINQKDAFFFKGRSRRPPLDNTNGLLSLAYTILGNECASALEGVGLDAYVGFYIKTGPAESLWLWICLKNCGVLWLNALCLL